MKVAVIGSRSIIAYPLEDIIPACAEEIISGGAHGVDTLVRAYAQVHGIPCMEIRPDYAHYGKGAPPRRNLEIIAKADPVIAIWDGKSTGTAYTIRKYGDLSKPVRVLP